MSSPNVNWKISSAGGKTICGDNRLAGPENRVCLVCYVGCFCECDKKFASFSPSAKLCIVEGKDTLKATRVSLGNAQRGFCICPMP